MLAQCGVDNAHIEENLARIADFVEFAKSIVEFIVVITSQGGYPSLDFLCNGFTLAYPSVVSPWRDGVAFKTDLFQRHCACLCTRAQRRLRSGWLSNDVCVE
jgi:hypothetical protein